MTDTAENNAAKGAPEIVLSSGASLKLTGWAATYRAGTEHSLEGKTITGLVVDGVPHAWDRSDHLFVEPGQDFRLAVGTHPGAEQRKARRKARRGR